VWINNDLKRKKLTYTTLDEIEIPQKGNFTPARRRQFQSLEKRRRVQRKKEGNTGGRKGRAGRGGGTEQPERQGTTKQLRRERELLRGKEGNFVQKQQVTSRGSGASGQLLNQVRQDAVEKTCASGMAQRKMTQKSTVWPA